MYNWNEPKERSYHADLGLLTRAGWAHESLQLLSDLLIFFKNLSELLDKVLRLPGVRKILFNTDKDRERQLLLHYKYPNFKVIGAA